MRLEKAIRIIKSIKNVSGKVEPWERLFNRAKKAISTEYLPEVVVMFRIERDVRFWKWLCICWRGSFRWIRAGTFWAHELLEEDELLGHHVSREEMMFLIKEFKMRWGVTE